MIEPPKLSGKDFDRIQTLLKNSIFALDAEIEAVKERPSQDNLEGGSFQPRKAGEENDYVFKSTNAGLRFAEKIKARLNDKVYEVTFVEAKEDEIVLRFPEHMGPQIPSVDLEWENDFVLRRMQDQLKSLLLLEEEEKYSRIANVFYPSRFSRNELQATEYARRLYEMGGLTVRQANRNEAQCEAIQKAMYNEVSFIWGPPGTGKTTTLGYVIANLILQDKKVLFVSNTNRAVDVGMLAVMEALLGLDQAAMIPDISRFGDIALESESMERIHHAKLADARRARMRQKAAQYQDLLAMYKAMNDEAESIENDGGMIPPELDQQIEAALSHIRKAGGLRKMQSFLDSLAIQLQNADFFELISKRVVGTTLAKVCTSELFSDLDFDAVVVDESSMASLPYMVVMASRCKQNFVVAGDPMQLPPISITSDAKARELLEQDIFAFASGAAEPAELFMWHDYNPLITSFFDIQYRLNQDLADVISDVFYEGRLKTGKALVHSGVAEAGASKTEATSRKRITSAGPEQKSFQVIDTSMLGPELTKKKSNFGFSPKNEVHLQVLIDLLKRLVFKELVPAGQIGIMVPFRSVLWDVKLLLRKNGMADIEVGTVHTFQGREKRVIVFDTVMSGEFDRGRVTHFSVRPFDEAKNGLSVPRLLNVAFSRAKDRLFIIADMNHVRHVYGKKFLGKLLEKMVNNR